MGVWGTSIYGNDVAADMRALFRDLVRLPQSAEQLIGTITASFPEAASPEDESYSDFCLALADLFHVYGIDAKPVREQALKIIVCGSDLDKKRELGMTQRDLRQRARVLERLSQKLDRPNPKPRNRRILAKPEKWIFEDGAVVVYPTCQNEPVNPYMPDRLMTTWSQDCWGGFVVLGRTRLLGYFAVHLIAILAPVGPSCPGLSDVVAGKTLPCCAALVTLPPAHARRMRLTTIGYLRISEAAVEAEFLPGRPPFTFRPQHLANALLLDVPTSHNRQSQSDLRQFLR